MNFTPRGDGPSVAIDADLRQLSEERAPILQQLSEGVIIADTEGRLVFVNEAAERLHGVKQLGVAPDDYTETYRLFTLDGEIYPFEDLPLARAVLRGETVEDARWRIRRPDGSEVVAIGSARPLVAHGRQIGAILTVRDDSSRFEAERRLRESENLFRLVLDAAPGAFYAVDREGNTNLVSSGFLDLIGFKDESEALGRKLHNLIHHSHPDGSRYPVEQCPIYQCASAGIPAHVSDEFFFRLDGTPVPVEYWVSPIVRGDAHVGAICTILDLTQRKAAETAVLESEVRFRNMADHAPVMMWVTEPDGSCSYLNRAWYEFTGQLQSEAQGMAWLDAVHPGDRGWSGETFLSANARQEAFRLEYRLRRADGVYRWAIDAGAPRFGPNGEFLGFIGSVIDIGDRREAEEALAVKAAEFETLAENVSQLAWMAEPDGSIFWYNKRWYDYTGTDLETMKDWGWRDVHHPDHVDRVIEEVTKRWAAGVTWEGTYLLRSASGEYRPFLTRAEPIRDENGALLRWFGTNTDITAQMKAENSLRQLNETLEQRVEEEVDRRNRAEEALRQSQKMETLGQLTGGIAHDFNNLLQIITGNLDIIQRGLPEDSARLRRSAENAAKGADRAAVLTQRLLAFSRRQPLAPKVIDANKLVAGMSEMLFRSLGETVELETVLSSGLWRVEVDPNQLESAILNLAVNGRDAMEGGGKLTIETANAHLDHAYVSQQSGLAPGQYVVICVTDDGAGMDPVTAQRAFDPFFTTKEVGKGTGLGLSMVYGFVKQSGGHLKIYSELGEGTTVRIYLPRHYGAEDVREESEQDEAIPRGSKDETILVCEDDDDVRAYSVETLRELGYRVIEAADGESTLRLLDAGEKVDLLFTDVVLPGGMTGAMVAERARKLQPGLKVLFTTGYARDAIVHHGRLDPGVELLSKPFAHSDLAMRIRALLDAA